MGDAGGGAAAGAPPPGGAGAGCVIDYAFYEAVGVAPKVPRGGDEAALAARLLRLLVGFVRDVSTVYEVMATFYRYMDAKRQWREPRIVEVGGGGGGALGLGRAGAGAREEGA